MERKMEGKKKEREGPSVTTCEVLCLVFYFFFSRKTAFGLNLKEAENGRAVALGGELWSGDLHLQ